MHPRFNDSLEPIGNDALIKRTMTEAVKKNLPKSILQPKEEIEVDMETYKDPIKTASFARPQTAKPSDHPGFAD